MINQKSTVFDLINPCRVTGTARHQAFVESNASQYTPGSEIQFTLPNGENLDMTQSYIDCLISLNETDAETPTVFELDFTGFVGSFYFTYLGLRSDILDQTATALEIQTALQDMPTIGGLAYTADVSGGPVFTITIYNTGGFGIFGENGALQAVFDSVTTPPTNSFLVLISLGENRYPRLDFLAPVVQSIRIDVSGEQILNIADATFLNNIMELLHSPDQKYAQYYMNNQNYNGINPGDGVQFRIKINIDAIDLLKKILPLRYINKLVKVYIRLNQAAVCLQQKSNVSQGTYLITTPKLHYHRITLHEDDERALSDAYNSGGLVIPFQSWQTFSSSLNQGPQNPNVLFNPSVSNMLGVFFIMVPNNWASDVTNPNKTSVFLRNRIGQYRLKLGSRYFPLDQIDSVSPGNKDFTMIITELENMIGNLVHVEQDVYARQIYFNFGGSEDGDLPQNTFYNIEFAESFRNTFIAGISTCDVPSSKYGFICPNDALTGQNTTTLSNVSLELKGLELGQPCTLYIYTLSQEYLVISQDGIKWHK